MAVADRMGIEPRLLMETITASRAATVSNLFAELGKNIVAQSYHDATFSVELLCKDTRLAVETARDHHAAPLLAQTIQFLNEAALLQGFGKLDTAVMWKACQHMWQAAGADEMLDRH
jgi:3-hydroxyisobutyrate dehydrogenase-like beta-hydroxyacid dehydrogenase